MATETNRGWRNRSSSTTAIEPTTVVAESTTTDIDSVKVEIGVDLLEASLDIDSSLRAPGRVLSGMRPLTRMTLYYPEYPHG